MGKTWIYVTIRLSKYEQNIKFKFRKIDKTAYHSMGGRLSSFIICTKYNRVIYKWMKKMTK